VRDIWDWGVCSVICNVRAAFGNGGCRPKCKVSRRREKILCLVDRGNEGNPVFGPYGVWRTS